MIIEIETKLNIERLFKVLDVSNVLWHVQLEEGTSCCTLCNTPLGRYRWEYISELEFHVDIFSKELFQMKMNELIEGSIGIGVIADNLLIYGFVSSTKEVIIDYDEKLRMI